MRNCRFRAVVETAAQRLAFMVGGMGAAGRLALAVGGVAAAATASGEDLSAPLDKVAVRTVAAGETVTEADSIGAVSETGLLAKKGEGAYVLPVNRILDNATVKMVAAEGDFTYAFTSGVETVSEPTAVLNRANMWLDASNAGSLAFEDDDAVKVGTWRDVRDVRDGTDVHPRAVTSHRYYVSRSPEKTVDEGRDAIWFGGEGSGRYMVWRKPDGSTNAVNAAHVFLVAGIMNKLAWIVGSTTGGGFDTANGVWMPSVGVTQYGRVWQNGKLAEMLDARLTKGYQLLEMDMGALKSESMDSFFNCRNYQATNETGLGDTNAGNRAGGDHLCEVVVFTEKLTDRERLAVETYLLQKWNLNNTTMRGLSVAGVPTAQTHLRVDETTGDAVELLGTGVAVKQGASDAYVVPSLNGGVAFSPKPATPKGGMDATRARINSFDGQGRTFQGKVQVAEGGLYVNAPVALDVQAGDAITATRGNLGNKVTVAAGTAGTVVKKGTGEAVLQDLPSSAERLTVEAGRLVLKAPARADVGLGVNTNAGAKVALANAGFEDVTFPSDKNYLNLVADGSLCAGWTVTVGRGADNIQAGVSGKKSETQGAAAIDAYNLPVPHSGNAQLVLQVSATAETTVAIPADGFYDLSFWMAGTGWGGVGGDSYLGLDVSLVAPNGVTTTVGRAYAPRFDYEDGRTYRLVRFRTPYLTAGTGWTLRFATAAVKQVGFVIDDVDLTCLPDLPDSRVIPLPNGDFETYTGASYRYFDRADATNNAAEGWTFTQPGDYDPSVRPRAPRAGLVFGNRPYRESWMDGQRFGVNYGEAALCFAGAGGVATSSSLTLSAGTYYLRGTVAARRLGQDAGYGLDWDTWDGACITARVTTTQGTVDLGTITCLKQIPETRRWPIGFTVAEGETVTFSLSGGNKRVALVDDLVLVKATSPFVNLLSNGDFETFNDATPAVWEQTVGTGASKVQRLKYGEWYDMHYARGYFEGTGYGRLTGTSAISQTVTVPSAGIYRFTMHEQTRLTGNDKPGLRVTLTDAANAEIEILRIEPKDDIAHEIVRWTRDFRIAQAGDYTLRIATLEENGADKSSQLDDISLVQVDETAVEAAPALSDQTVIEVKEGATLALDFPGELTVRRLILGGRRYAGTITAEQFPAYLSGPGTIKVPRRGAVLIYR